MCMEHSPLLQDVTALNSSGSLQSYRVHAPMTIAALLQQLKLDMKFFAILCNGRAAKLTDEVIAGDEIVILPKIAGG